MSHTKSRVPKTLQTLHLTAVVKQAKHAVLMTGTPIQGKSTIDYFSQVFVEWKEYAIVRDNSVVLPLLKPLKSSNDDFWVQLYHTILPCEAGVLSRLLP